MTLYARSDLMSVSIPVTSGGCGDTHSRPVNNGAPARTWGLDCPDCEAHLRGDKKKKIIHTIPGDKEKGIPARLTHVADADPHWSNAPEGVPLTPDEQHLHKLRAEQGKQQLDMLTAYAALSKVPGLDLKDFHEATWLLNQTLDPLKRPRIEGEIVCAEGHGNPASTKFCGECGISMTVQGALTAGEIKELYQEPDTLVKLHVATLRKMCREKGLSDRGTKAELIKRLTVPATIKLSSTTGFDADDGNYPGTAVSASSLPIRSLCREHRAYVNFVADPGEGEPPASVPHGLGVIGVKPISVNATVSWKMITGSARNVLMISGSSKLPKGGV